MSESYIHVLRQEGDVVASGESRFSVVQDVPGESAEGAGVFARWEWDGSCLHVSNCRHGVYPLYYSATGQEVCVSTSLVRLLAVGASPRLDDSAIAFFLRAGHFAGDDTPFEAIRLVPPGGRFEWHRDGHWRVVGGSTVVPPLHLTRDEAIDAFIETFRGAVRRRAHSRDCVMPLSGGRDSRHILLELVEAGCRPTCVTVRHSPPRRDEDARVAGLLTKALGLGHTIVNRWHSPLQAELRKNRLTSFSTDWHAWLLPMVDLLQGRNADVYSGHGGDTLARGVPLNRKRLDLWRAGDMITLADFMHQKRPHLELALQLLMSPDSYERFSRARAHARLVDELRRHVDQPNPELAFTFYNALRRRTAPMWFPLCSDVANVYTPYLDPAVYDVMAGLPLELYLDKAFHTEAIHRAFPRYRDIPFAEGPATWGKADGPWFRQFADEVTEYVLSQNSQIVDTHSVVERLSGARHTGDGRCLHWLNVSRLLCLLQLEEAVRTVSANREGRSDERELE